MRNTLSNTDSIVFYDDDVQSNIEPFRESYPNIKSIIVPSDKPYNQILKGQSNFYYPFMYLKKYKNNRYAQELVKKMKINDKQTADNLCDQCENTTNQGITEQEMRKIVKWSNNKRVMDKTVLFDWDNTISVCNGIFMPLESHKEWSKNTEELLKQNLFNEEEVAQYCAGTLERFRALKKMFRILRQNEVHCHILTNNGWGKLSKTNYPLVDVFFLKVVQVLDPWMRATDIICGRDVGKVQKFKETDFLIKRYNSLRRRPNKKNKTKKKKNLIWF